MKTGFINIIDPVSDGVYIFQFLLDDKTPIEAFLISKGFDINKIKWMITDTIKLTIK